MEEEAPLRRSVAELAGRFKDSAPPQEAGGHETEKPVRRRPPRSLQLPKTHGDQGEGVTSPLPSKAKRNSALIEKLQANLALSPSALLTSPKSPGFRLLPPAFPPPSPSSAPVTLVSPSTLSPTSPFATSPLTEEEGPASFEAPPTVAEESILKGRARHSIRRRPPSRCHRHSSSGEEVSMANEDKDPSLCSPSDPEDKIPGGGGGGDDEDEEVFKQDVVKEDKTDSSTVPEERESHKKDQSVIGTESREEEEKMVGEKESTGGKERIGSSSGREDEEEAQEKNTDKQEELSEGTTKMESKEKEKETMNHSSIR